MTDNYMKIHPDDWRQLLKDIELILNERDEANEVANKYEDRYFSAILERDEARRLYLASTFSEDEIIHEMKRHGWDCFKEDGKPCQ